MRLEKHFDTWGEFLEFAKREPLSFTTKRSRDLKDETWFGTDTFEDAMNLATNGWVKGASIAERIANPIFMQISSLIEVPEYRFDTEGADYDIGLAVKGIPECWITEVPTFVENKGNRVLRIVNNVFVSAGISRDVINAKGSVLVALITLLEFAGYRCEVISRLHTDTDGMLSVTVKHAEDALDVPRLMFALAHPSMFRRLMFSVTEQFRQIYTSHYCRPMSLPEEYRGDIYFECQGYYESQWQSPEYAHAWIVEQLKAQGVQLTEVNV